MNYKPGEATLFDSTSFGFTGQAILRDTLPNDPLNRALCARPQWNFQTKAIRNGLLFHFHPKQFCIIRHIKAAYQT